MLQTNAIFSRKESNFETKSCTVEKVIRLSGAEYDSFTRNMLRDQDFIKDNVHLMYHDADKTLHCLLVVGEGRRDGVLIDSSGSDYARYSAFIPNAEDFLTVGRSPALTALNRKLTDMAEHIAAEVNAAPAGERAVVDLQDLETRFGIDLMTNGVLRDTVLDMLGTMPGMNDFELDKNELIIYRETQGAVLTTENTAPVHAAKPEKPSVIDQLKAARQAPCAPQGKDAQKPNHDKGGPEL